MSNSSNPSRALILSVSLLLGACGGSVDVVASDDATSEDSLAEDQPGGAWEIGHDRSGGSTATTAERNEGGQPSAAWELGHSIAASQLLTGSIEITLAPGEARSLCHLIPVDGEFVAHLAQHEMSDLPSSVELVATGASAEAARMLPSVFDCHDFSMPEAAPFYAAQEACGAILEDAALATIPANGGVLLRYDVANPGAEAVMAAVHVALVR